MSVSQTVVVRPKISLTDEDPVAKALAVFKMSKFAGCPDNYIGAAMDRKMGRYLTGLDENHPDILALPQVERLAKQKEITEERAFLEKELGINLHHTNEDFWHQLPIILDGTRSFNLANPMDRVIVKAIEAGKLIPTKKADISNPEFKNANFYLGLEFEDVEDKNKLRDRDSDVIFELRTVLGDFDYAIEVAKYLSISGVSERMPLNNLKDLLYEYLERKSANKDSFLAAMKEERKVITLYNKFRDFKIKGLVRFEDGAWKVGKVRLGKTEKESVKKLLSANPEMAAELSRLLEDYKELTEK